MMRSPACESWGKSRWHWCCADMGAVHTPSPQGLAVVSQGAGAACSLGRSLTVMDEGETSGDRSFTKYLVYDTGDPEWAAWQCPHPSGSPSALV